ncbi:DNA-3-methyladenine glycosylase [Candidatus Dojkabacteria bacterium]|nr:DNA-3-methyladenine glycosylase [Candidatus Dojkabacteria bacterium]
MGKILPREFYRQDTRKVAEELLGKLLVRSIDGERLSGMIVETEAYRGFDDTASHAHKGPTERCKVMFGEAGFAYIYITYGLHNMLNVVTEKTWFPSAVLIRAIEPVEGIKMMAKVRKVKSVRDLTSGPGRVTKALMIDRELNGIDLTSGGEVWIEDTNSRIASALGGPAFRGGWSNGYKVLRSPRKGIDYADKSSRERKWRFYVKDNKFVSK